MPREATGQVVERTTKAGATTYALRFRAGGRRRFESLGAVTREQAERRLRHVLADVERGRWEPPAPAAPEVPTGDGVTFAEYSATWARLAFYGKAPATIEDYSGRLDRHLIPAFGHMPLADITVGDVRDYLAAKLDAGLSPRTVNMTLDTLAAVLEEAVEEGLIDRNPAKGRNRRAKRPRKEAVYLSSAAQIEVMLEAAAQLDAEAPERFAHLERRATIATLMFTGMRIGELCRLRWRHVDLAGGWLAVPGTKTENAARHVMIRGALRDVLGELRARAANLEPTAPVFPTSAGKPQDSHNLRNRVFHRTADRARELAAERGIDWPEGKLVPHSMRHTFASVMCAIGEDRMTTREEIGHADPLFTERVYTHAMKRGEAERERLRELTEGKRVGTQWAHGPFAEVPTP